MRLLLFALWLALIAIWFSGCRKPHVPTAADIHVVGMGIDLEAPERMLSDGIVTCELRRGESGRVYEKSNIPLGRCFAIWLMDNAEQDHYEEWFNKQYGNTIPHEVIMSARKHCLGRS